MEVFFIRAGALGDAVLTLPVIEAFRENRPCWKISVIGSYPLLSLLKGSRFADELFPIDSASFSSFFSGGDLSSCWVERFRRAEFVFVLLEDFNLFINLKRAGIQKVVMTCGIGEGEHVADKLLSVLPQAGIRSGKTAPEIFIPEEEKKFAEDFLKSHGLFRKKLAAVHPGSGSKKKNWPAERFAAVGRKLIDDYGMRLIVVRGEADSDEVEEFMKFFKHVEVPAADGLNILRLAAVLSKCRIYIGNDSGVSHLAAASGTPSVCVFGPTDPEIWAPRGREVRIVRKVVSCSPCSREERNSCVGQECLHAVEPEDVLEQACLIRR